MTKFTCALVAAVVAIGCGGTPKGTKQLDNLTEAVAEVADSLRDLKGVIKSTLDEHNLIVNNTDGDYRGHYEKFAEGVDDIKDGRDDAKADVDDMRAAAVPFFEQWKLDLAKYNDPDMRARGEARMAETKTRYDEVKKQGDIAKKAYNAMMATLEDHRLAWERDLNAGSAADMKKYRPELEKNWATARDAINAVILWAEKYKASVETRKPADKK